MLDADLVKIRRSDRHGLHHFDWRRACSASIFRVASAGTRPLPVPSPRPRETWSGALIVVMLVMFVLGFFLDFIEITLVAVPLVAPILLAHDGDQSDLARHYDGHQSADELSDAALWLCALLPARCRPQGQCAHQYRFIERRAALRLDSDYHAGLAERSSHSLFCGCPSRSATPRPHQWAARLSLAIIKMRFTASFRSTSSRFNSWRHPCRQRLGFASHVCVRSSSPTWRNFSIYLRRPFCR